MAEGEHGPDGLEVATGRVAGSSIGLQATQAGGPTERGEETDAGGQGSLPDKVVKRPVLYPNQYCWFVLLSALDIMLTHTILFRFRGSEYYGTELNTFADWVIKQAGLWGAVLLKSGSIITVVIILEFVGRRRPRLGYVLSWCIVAMAMVPVLVALVQLAAVAIL